MFHILTMYFKMTVVQKKIRGIVKRFRIVATAHSRKRKVLETKDRT